jgi:putative ATP-binding cassette transporter
MDVPAAFLPAPAQSAPRTDGSQFVGHGRALLRALARSTVRRWLLGLAVGIVLVIAANAVTQVRLNDWQGAFYDALGAKDMPAFLRELGVFFFIIAVLLALNVAQTWLQEMMKVRLREALTRDLLAEWLAPNRPYRLAFAGEIALNPDQRVQEDARHLTELTAGLAFGLLQSSLLLLSFIGVLWVLSRQVVFMTAATSFSIPGYMVWCAVAYALAGSALTRLVGRPLIRLNADRYAREADFRFALVRANDSAEGIALYGGEVDERRLLGASLELVVRMMLRLARGLARLQWVTAGYGWLAIVAPVLVAAPGYFNGTMTLGGLMMVAGAFYQVQQALRWYVDNYSQIADWRATLLRVMAFRDALQAIDALGAGAGRIARLPHPEGGLAFRGLRVLLPDGHAALDEGDVEIRPGERMMIIGEPGAGKSTMFRALAGLWPWGDGTLLVPPRGEKAFLQARPYFPLGTVRAAVAYPSPLERFSEGAVREALRRAGLARLAEDIDRIARLDKELSQEDQQRLVLARLLLNRPRWIFMDEALSEMSQETGNLVSSILCEELAAAAVVGFAAEGPTGTLFTRTLHLRHHPNGNALTLPPAAGASQAAPLAR